MGRSKTLRWIDYHLEETIACGLLVIMAICVLAQVVARYIFSLGLTWTEEVAAYCMVWSVYLGASVGVRHHFHIRLLGLVGMFPRPLALAAIVAGDLIWLAFNILMIKYATEYSSLLFSRQFTSPGLGIEQRWPHLVVLIGYVLMTGRLIQVYLIWWANGAKGLPAREYEAPI